MLSAATIFGSTPSTVVAEPPPIVPFSDALIAPNSPVLAPTGPKVAEYVQPPKIAPEGILVSDRAIPEPSTSTVAAYVKEIQKDNGLGDDFYDTLQCESGFTWNAVNSNDPGGSYGVAQINAPTHKDLTKDQMLDYRFAVQWAAEQFKAKNQAIWTCWRNLSSENRRTDSEP